MKKRIEKRKAFVCLLAALGLVAGAGLFSLTTRVRYRHHKRGGEEALRSRAFPDAIRALARAERLWVFGRQLCLGPSDLGSLIETVQALAVATKGAGLELPTGEYLSALLSVQRVRGWNKASDRETCRREWMRLRKARLELRTQLRRLEANSRAEPVHVRL